MLLVAVLVIAAAVVLMVRRVEVRLVLLGAGAVMALAAGAPLALADTFTRGMVTAMVAPICAAMGFAAVIAATGCDRHLVHLLLAPVRRVRWLVIPGGILAAYLVNMAVPSQTSTAAALGPILVPVLLGAGFAPEIAGAALILGASFGGDLLNPGAQDVQAIAGVTGISAPLLSQRVIPASLLGMLAATLVFALLYRRGSPRPAPEGDALVRDPERSAEAAGMRINVAKALVPVVPVILLLLAYGGVPAMAWLLATPDGAAWAPLANALPVVRAMLIGVVLAGIIGWREIQQLARHLFDGMGTAYGGIISLTICAQCFGAGIALLGVSEALLRLAGTGGARNALAAGFPWALAALSGSGSGPVLTFAQTFLAGTGAQPGGVTLGALACFGGAFGRTMSPVAAVVVYGSGLVGVPPLPLIKRFLPALATGAVVAITVVILSA